MNHDSEPDLPTSVETTAADAPVATGASELSEILARARDDGYATQFEVPGDDAPDELDVLRCDACRRSSPAPAFARAWSRRLEGASDPADMLHVSAITCPRCGAQGVFISPFGATSSARQTAVLQSLRRANDVT